MLRRSAQRELDLERAWQQWVLHGPREQLSIRMWRRRFGVYGRGTERQGDGGHDGRQRTHTRPPSSVDGYPGQSDHGVQGRFSVAAAASRISSDNAESSTAPDSMSAP